VFRQLTSYTIIQHNTGLYVSALKY